MQERQRVKSMSGPKVGKGRISSAFSQHGRRCEKDRTCTLSHVRRLLLSNIGKKSLGSFCSFPALWDVADVRRYCARTWRVVNSKCGVK